jgi:hypothetical protein
VVRNARSRERRGLRDVPKREARHFRGQCRCVNQSLARSWLALRGPLVNVYRAVSYAIAADSQERGVVVSACLRRVEHRIGPIARLRRGRGVDVPRPGLCCGGQIRTQRRSGRIGVSTKASAAARQGVPPREQRPRHPLQFPDLLPASQRLPLRSDRRRAGERARRARATGRADEQRTAQGDRTGRAGSAAGAGEPRWKRSRHWSE